MNFETIRKKYKPDIIKILFIAETPPKVDSQRFFYKETVEEYDSLFIETMKVLYPDEAVTAKEIRKLKEYFLTRFKDDGFYLIDSLEKPFEKKYSQNEKIKLIKSGQQKLLENINELCLNETKVFLISATVFKANYEFLKCCNVNVLNRNSIDFPSFGRQKKYKEKLSLELNITT